MMSVWTNGGQFYKTPSELKSLSDRGFLFGLRIMTTILVVDNKFIDLDRHLERLHRSAVEVGLDAGFRTEIIKFELESIITSFPQKFAACRVFITAGKGFLKSSIETPDRWIQLEAISAIQTEVVTKLQLQTDLYWRRGEKIKTGLYHDQIAEVIKVNKAGFSDILWCNSDQEICEATTANIFLLGREGDLVEIATPPVSSGILPGVTRARIMDLLNEAKIPVTERIIYRDEIPRFDEAFLSSSLAGLVPVAQIGSHKLHSTRHNSVFTHIQRLWQTWRGL